MEAMGFDMPRMGKEGVDASSEAVIAPREAEPDI
jgi:hypothetical protein